MSNHQFYVHIPAGVRGPFTLQQMQQGVVKGQVTPQHQVSYDGKSPFPASQIWSTLAPNAQPTQPAPAAKPVAAPGFVAPVIAAPVVAAPSFTPPNFSVGAPEMPVINTGAGPSMGPVINVGKQLTESEKVAKRQEEEANAGKEEPDTPLGTLIWGLATIAIGVGLFFWFNSLEQEGGRIKINWVVLIIYKTLGKYGVLGVFGVLGLFLAINGARDMVKGKKGAR